MPGLYRRQWTGLAAAIMTAVVVHPDAAVAGAIDGSVPVINQQHEATRQAVVRTITQQHQITRIAIVEAISAQTAQDIQNTQALFDAVKQLQTADDIQATRRALDRVVTEETGSFDYPTTATYFCANGERVGQVRKTAQVIADRRKDSAEAWSETGNGGSAAVLAANKGVTDELVTAVPDAREALPFDAASFHGDFTRAEAAGFAADPESEERAAMERAAQQALNNAINPYPVGEIPERIKDTPEERRFKYARRIRQLNRGIGSYALGEAQANKQPQDGEASDFADIAGALAENTQIDTAELPKNASYNDFLELMYSGLRFRNPNWINSLATDTNTLLREIAIMMAQQLHLDYERYRKLTNLDVVASKDYLDTHVIPETQARTGFSGLYGTSQGATPEVESEDEGGQ